MAAVDEQATVVAAMAGAPKIIDGDVAGLDESDQAHAADLRSRVSVKDLDRARDLIFTMRVAGIH